ncbi:RNA pyrophosphohydrolase [Paracoccus sp. Z330]|uniref:RNA pyrophosphohydrolase n=1 Tax=Paracoccus onchidii TaxID=3017813 RepID=A0ABT4ZHD1_9RHOB|nr:RNA pyrophosphohydrolase [Paracoccus onchidii]MDB6178768.1 RNA pyrophosphohydrolase [Paracoccus onchidii]
MAERSGTDEASGAERLGPGGLPYRPCAGVVLINAQGLVFAGQRLNWPGAWQMPQGGIDPGESPTQAALRELTEETGVAADNVQIIAEDPNWVYYDLPPELLGKAWKGKFGGQRQKWVLMRFLGQNSDICIETAHPEFDRWCWMPAPELLESIVPFKRAVYEQVLGSFSEYLAR